MKTNCGCTVPCGCGDKAFTTASSLTNCEGETCPEVFCQECITNCQPDTEFSISGNLFEYAKGARLDEVIQKLLIFLDNSACVDLVALGLKVTSVGSTQIKLAWVGATSNQYRVHWTDGLNSFSASATGLNSFNITNLAPDTIYSIYVSTDASSCQSVTLKVKTKLA